MRMTPTEKQMRVLLERFVFDKTPSHTKSYLFTKEEVSLLCRHVQRTRKDPEYAERIEVGNTEKFACLSNALENDLVHLTREHEWQGLAWLWSQHGRPWLGAAQLRIMQRMSKITLVGVAEHGGPPHTMYFYTAPIYRVHGDSGSFTYEAWSWQSGVVPKLI